MIRCFCLALLVACVLPFAATAQVGPPQDRYIVVLNEGLDLPEDVAADVALRTGGRVGYVYDAVLRGFSITMPRAALASVERDPRVDYVEEDKPVRAFSQTIPTGILRIFSDASVGNGVADPIDVDVAVLDTGIDVDHPDLTVAGGTNCLNHTGGPPFTRKYFCDDSGNYDDGNSHGTHVGGTIGAIDNGIGVVGVAPGARLWAVKVLDDQGSGSFAGVIAGINWVVEHGDIEVINMSLGGDTGGQYQPMDDAVTGAVTAGVTVVVAAGNSDADTKNYSPANSPDAFTASALADFDGVAGGLASSTCRTDEDDTLANFSNWDPNDADNDGEGDFVNIVAPGVCILSTVPGGYDTFSGTSMASPHVAGAAALLASPDDTTAPLDRNGVEAIWHTLKYNGNCDWVDDSSDGYKEHLLDVSVLDPGVDPNICPLDETSEGDGGGGGGTDGTAVMFVSAISMTDKDYGPGGTFHDLSTTVTISHDTGTVSNASVTICVDLNWKSDPNYDETDPLTGLDCESSGSTTTDGSGQATLISKRAPAGTHAGFVSALSHDEYEWDKVVEPVEHTVE